MTLRIYGENSSKLINVAKEFFDASSEGRGEYRRIITPSEKAEQIGKDTYGRSYLGHILEYDGKLISKTLENREGKDNSLDVRRETRFNSNMNRKGSSQGFKPFAGDLFSFKDLSE